MLMYKWVYNAIGVYSDLTCDAEDVEVLRWLIRTCNEESYPSTAVSKGITIRQMTSTLYKSTQSTMSQPDDTWNDGYLSRSSLQY